MGDSVMKADGYVDTENRMTYLVTQNLTSTYNFFELAEDNQGVGSSCLTNYSDCDERPSPAIETYEARIIDRNPRIFSWIANVNDNLGGPGVPQSIYNTQFRQIMSDVENRTNITTYILISPGTGPGSVDSYNHTNIDNFMQVFREYAIEKGYPFVDFFKYTKFNSSLFVDTVHLNEDGHSLLADYVIDAIQNPQKYIMNSSNFDYFSSNNKPNEIANYTFLAENANDTINTVVDLVNITPIGMYINELGVRVNITYPSNTFSPNTEYLVSTSSNNLTFTSNENGSTELVFNSSHEGSVEYIILDITPIISLVSPSNNTFSNGNQTFKFNVTDDGGITNCSLILDGSVNSTDESISIDINQTFSKVLSAGSHNWSVNCTDNAGNENSTETRTITIVKSTGFAGNSTDFSQFNSTSIQNIANLILEKPNYGKINFSQSINLSGGKDIDTYVNISDKTISINSTALSELNKSAILSFYGVTYTDPGILKDGTTCPSTICQEVSYSSNTYIANVTGFSTYTITETYSAPVTEEETPTSSGGGGGGFQIYYPTELNLQEGYSKVLGKNWKLRFKFGNETHDLKVDEIQNNSTTITISSNPLTFNLSINETKKVDFDNNGFYDISVLLKNITGNTYYRRAEVYIKSINEEIQNQSNTKEQDNNINDEENQQEKEIKETSSEIIKDNKFIIYGIIGLVAILLILLIIRLFKSKFKIIKKKSKPKTHREYKNKIKNKLKKIRGRTFWIILFGFMLIGILFIGGNSMTGFVVGSANAINNNWSIFGFILVIGMLGLLIFTYRKKIAERMEISQPTFSRILKTAREKIAKAIIQGKAIKINKSK
jgi:hypothetical protein